MQKSLENLGISKIVTGSQPMKPKFGKNGFGKLVTLGYGHNPALHAFSRVYVIEAANGFVGGFIFKN